MCPSISCTSFKLAPFSNRCVANECLRVCGDISLSIFAFKAYFLICLQKYCLDIGAPSRLRKRYLVLFLAYFGLTKVTYLLIKSKANSPIGTILSLLPLPFIFKYPSLKFIFPNCKLSSSDTLKPDA